MMLVVILVVTIVRLSLAGGRWYLAYQFQLGFIALLALAGAVFDNVPLAFLAWALFAVFVLLPTAMLSRASRLLAAGQVKGAAQMWRGAALFLWGKLGHRYGQYGHLFSTAFDSNPEEVEQQIDQMLAAPQPAPLRSSLLAFKFLIYSLRHDWQKAVSFFESVSKWGSSEAALGAQLQAARAYAELGNFPEAIGLLNRVLAEPQSFRLRQAVFLTQTSIFSLAGDLDRLKQFFRRNRRLLRQLPAAFESYWLGRCHMARGERSEAALALQEAREVIPRHHTRWRDAVDSRLLKLEEATELKPLGFAQSEPYERALAMLEETKERNWEIKALLDLLRPAPAMTILALLLILVHAVQPVLVELVGRRFGRNVDAQVILSLFANRSDSVIVGGEYWRLLSALFLHAGWMHLCLNAAVLVAFGSAIERLWGRTRAVLLFVAAGIGGNWLSAYLGVRFGDGVTESVGASGGVFGLLAGYWLSAISVHLPKHRRFKLQLIVLVSLIILTDISIGLLTTNEPFALFIGAHIDNWAHIGGLVVGLALGWFLKPPSWSKSVAPLRPPSVIAPTDKNAQGR
jgi:membrane associated rhomboid family serine protease